MQAKIITGTVGVTFEMTQKELDLFMEGIGRTSLYKLEHSGLSEQEAKVLHAMWHALNEHMNKED